MNTGLFYRVDGVVHCKKAFRCDRCLEDFVQEQEHSFAEKYQKKAEDDGAVSEEVVIEMVEGARAAMGVDYALATSGILGPGGGSILKPVGTVWIAVASAEKTVARKFLFQYDRKRNLLGAATQGLNMLRELIAES